MAFVGSFLVNNQQRRGCVTSRRSRCARVVRMSVEPDFGEEPKVSESTVESVDDAEKKKKEEIERLRAAEKFIEIDEGAVECMACGFKYEPLKGDKALGVPKGTPFKDFPSDFRCPACNSPRSTFSPVKKIVAGFAENQSYGFGGNSLTEGQKSGLIFGGLAIFFVLFLSGYLLN